MRLLFLLTVLFLFSCRRAGNITNEHRTGLTGKWVAVEQFVSPGAGGSWYPLAPPDQFTIEFFADSSFAYSPNFPKAGAGFTRYSIDNTLIRVRNAANTETDAWHHNPNPGDTLNLSVFTCFEGCAYGLRRAD